MPMQRRLVAVFKCEEPHHSEYQLQSAFLADQETNAQRAQLWQSSVHCRRFLGGRARVPRRPESPMVQSPRAAGSVTAQ